MIVPIQVSFFPTYNPSDVPLNTQIWPSARAASSACSNSSTLLLFPIPINTKSALISLPLPNLTVFIPFCNPKLPSHSSGPSLSCSDGTNALSFGTRSIKHSEINFSKAVDNLGLHAGAFHAWGFPEVLKCEAFENGFMTLGRLWTMVIAGFSYLARIS
jgi:hypothetical protein